MLVRPFLHLSRLSLGIKVLVFTLRKRKANKAGRKRKLEKEVLVNPFLFHKAPVGERSRRQNRGKIFQDVKNVIKLCSTVRVSDERLSSSEERRYTC